MPITRSHPPVERKKKEKRKKKGYQIYQIIPPSLFFTRAAFSLSLSLSMLPSRYNSAAHHCLNSTRPTNQQEAEKGPFSSRSHRLLNDQPRLTFSLSARVFTHFHDGEIYLAKEREKKYLPYIRFHLHFFTSYFHDRPFIP